MDVDHDNLLSLTEFTDGLKKYGLTFEDETAHELFTYIDKTCRGSIKFEEFLLAIRVIYINKVLIRTLRVIVG